MLNGLVEGQRLEQSRGACYGKLVKNEHKING